MVCEKYLSDLNEELLILNFTNPMTSKKCKENHSCWIINNRTLHLVVFSKLVVESRNYFVRKFHQNAW